MLRLQPDAVTCHRGRWYFPTVIKTTPCAAMPFKPWPLPPQAPTPPVVPLPPPRGPSTACGGCRGQAARARGCRGRRPEALDFPSSHLPKQHWLGPITRYRPCSMAPQTCSFQARRQPTTIIGRTLGVYNLTPSGDAGSRSRFRGQLRQWTSGHLVTARGPCPR